MPPMKWQCMCTGRPISVRRALTSWAARYGTKRPAHIFDAQRISAQLGELARVGNVVVERVDRAPRVRDRGFKMRADLFDGRRAITDVIYVVQGIEHTEDVDAIGMGTFNKPLNHIR